MVAYNLLLVSIQVINNEWHLLCEYVRLHTAYLPDVAILDYALTLKKI